MKRMLSTLAIVSAVSMLALAGCSKKEPVSGPSGDAGASPPVAASSGSAASDAAMGAPGAGSAASDAKP